MLAAVGLGLAGLACGTDDAPAADLGSTRGADAGKAELGGDDLGASDLGSDAGRGDSGSDAGVAPIPERLGPVPLPGGGYRFRVFSAHATRLELWTFAAAGEAVPTSTHAMSKVDDRHWQLDLPDAQVGLLYGLRAWGPNWPYDPAWTPGTSAGLVAHVDGEGNRFNPNKLLMDPAARALTGETGRFVDGNGQERYDPAVLGGTDAFAFVDSAPAMPRSVVVDATFDWSGDAAPGTAREDSLVYEVHLRGFTKAHPDVPTELRGTYDGFARNVAHLKRLGVTAVELLPIHEHNAFDDPVGTPEDRRNYWGYMTLGFFAPNRDYLCTERMSCAGAWGEEVRAFKRLVRALHAEGIEVWLDVVYNHTGEGGGTATSPVRYHSFRGLDNAGYYTLADDPRYYWESTGTGNNLNASSEGVRELVLESLRYWIEDMHVDGFRFDLAYTLGRVHDGGRTFDGGAPLLLDIAALGHRTGTKMVAEAWDTGGYGVGSFPDGWMEWNGRWRDSVRRFVKSDGGEAGAMGSVVTASHDGFATPDESVGFVTAHDGFTLNDLVSYDHKQNGVGPCNPTGADPNSGSNDDDSWSTSSDEGLRRQQLRNFFAQLFLQQGVPMLLGGDERRRTQHGNNNGYMADNACGWQDWSASAEADRMQAFVEGISALRAAHPGLGRARRIEGTDHDSDGYADLAWHGVEPDQPDFSESSRALAYLIDGSAGETGRAVDGPDLYVAMNAHWESHDFRLPTPAGGACWDLVLDTASWAEGQGNIWFQAGSDWSAQRLPSIDGDRYGVNPRSTVVLVARDCAAPTP